VGRFPSRAAKAFSRLMHSSSAPHRPSRSPFPASPETSCVPGVSPQAFRRHSRQRPSPVRAESMRCSLGSAKSDHGERLPRCCDAAARPPGVKTPGAGAECGDVKKPILPQANRLTLHPAEPGSGGGRAVGSLLPLEGGMGLRCGVNGTDARRPRARPSAP
jgi:hypothetical protein